MNLQALDSLTAAQPKAGRQPAIFIGHGSPMNIIRDNSFTRSLAELGQRHGKPSTVLVVSAHWLTRSETSVSINPKPPTVHDFGGFPDELYRIEYPAPGSPAAAHEAAAHVSSVRVHEDHEMGLDHGAWSILRHIWPEADVPVFQMSIDYDSHPGSTMTWAVNCEPCATAACSSSAAATSSTTCAGSAPRRMTQV